MIVILDVDAAVSVAAGVNGSAPVGVIVPVSGSFLSPPERREPDRPRGSLTSTGAFPFTRAATITSTAAATSDPF